MKKVIGYIFLGIFMISVSGLVSLTHAQKSEQAIKQLMEERDQEIKTLLGPEGTEYTQQQRQELKDIINGVINYSAMAEYALQDTWGEISEEERREFIDLFSTIIRDQSLNKLDIYRSEVTYRSIDINGNDAVVNTMATRQNVRTPVIYEMHYNTDGGQWVVTNFSIDDVSTADSYRRQFQDIIRKEGFDSLMETLRKRAGR